MKFKLVKFKPKPTQIKGLECLNCGQPLLGTENFCSYCGQKNTTRKLTFNNFISNIFSGFTSYDSRFWKTFIPLLTKPGKVSKDYIEGKRSRFVNPFQLYLNVSIIFFLLLGITTKIDENKSPINNIIENTQNLDSITQKGTKQLDSIIENAQNKIIQNNPKDSTKAKVITDLGEAFRLIEKESNNSKKVFTLNMLSDSISNASGFYKKIQNFINYHEKFPKYTNLQALDSLGYKKTFGNKFYYQQVINITQKIKQVQSDGGKSYFKTLTSYISISLFVFLPIFTLFLKAVYFRRKYTYMEHLVFVFHTQTVVFLLFVIYYLLNFFVEMESTWWVIILLFLLYLYKALRHFYEQGRIKTIVKFIILNNFYLFLGFIGFAIVAIVSFIIG